MPYTGLLSWHIKETAGQFYSKPRDRKCKLDYLIKYMTILVENVKCSVCKNKAGGLFPSSEFSHEALEIQHSASTRSRELRFNCGSVINVRLFTLCPVTQYMNTLCHETLKCPPVPGCGIWPTG